VNNPSIIVRPATAGDMPRIRELYQAQGFEYEQPNWAGMMVSAVVEVDGKIEMAALFRQTAETYLLLDPNSPASKKERLGQLFILHKELVKPCERKGLTDIHCWLPPALDQRFGKLLLHFGWKKALWPTYSREVNFGTRTITKS
jgi:hypothetical protein